MNRQSTLGAWPTNSGTRFRVWAPLAHTIEAVGEGSKRFALEKRADGTFGGVSASFRAGDRYAYLIDGEGPYPDPASRSQPEGVHGPSEIIDPARFAWSDASWRGIARGELILYELHVGTFTPEGTFAGVASKLDHLVRLGVNAIELMPVAEFAGRRNWGYDGVDLFAPSRCYGTPDDLRRLVDCAHRMGLAVLIDVVYNHFGPSGNYLGRFSPYYISESHRTPWGAAVNLDGSGSAMVREFLIQNALCWIDEYHCDGLRLDATHALIDDSPTHFLAELGAQVHDSSRGRHIHLIAEDHRNLAVMLRPRSALGWGLDGVWSDDFHHQVRRLLAGDADGVYQDFHGTVADLVTTLNDGWLFRGEYSNYRGRNRGTDPAGIDRRKFVFFIQNHDRIGNRALGDRLNQQIDVSAYRAATMLLMCVPETPLLFMGQEWAAQTRFLFFTDHDEELGRQVREGRRREFRHYAAFQDPHILEQILDPQDAQTFLRSKLDWSELEREDCAAMFRLNRALIALRRTELNRAGRKCVAIGLDDETLALHDEAVGGSTYRVIIKLRGAGRVTIRDCASGVAVLSTEDSSFCADPHPIAIESRDDGCVLNFARPGGIVLALRADGGPSARSPADAVDYL